MRAHFRVRLLFFSRRLPVASAAEVLWRSHRVARSRLRFALPTNEQMASFEDLEVFKKAIELMVSLYRLTENFPRSEMYGLTSQVRRSSGSVVAHIAEGQGRLSFGEWRQMLSQARGSLFETEAHLIAAKELSYLDPETFATIRAQARHVGRLLHGLIRYVQRREAQTKSRQKPKRSGNRQPATNAATSP